MIVLRCTLSRAASARVPGKGSPGFSLPLRMSLASASASCTNIGEPRRGSSAVVSSSQFSIERDRTGPVEFEEGDLQGDPVADIHSRTFFREGDPHAHLHTALHRSAARMWNERTAGSPGDVAGGPKRGQRAPQPDALPDAGAPLRTEHHAMERAPLELHL